MRLIGNGFSYQRQQECYQTPDILQNLNYDDTEEMPSNEGIDKCHLFDMDIETLPLY